MNHSRLTEMGEAIDWALGRCAAPGPVPLTAWTDAQRFRFLDGHGRPTRRFLECYRALLEEGEDHDGAIASIVEANVEAAELLALGMTYIGPLEESTADVFAAPGNVARVAA